MKDLSKVLLSLIVGAAAGVAAGLLLAPDKGENTRKKVKDSFNDLSEKAKKALRKEKEIKDEESA
jgi:gas vesicle protein